MGFDIGFYKYGPTESNRYPEELLEVAPHPYSYKGKPDWSPGKLITAAELRCSAACNQCVFLGGVYPASELEDHLVHSYDTHDTHDGMFDLLREWVKLHPDGWFFNA